MNRISTAFVAAALVTLTACGGGDVEIEEVPAVDPMVETAPEASPVETGSALLDPNTATAEQMVAAGLNAETAAAIVAGRPFGDVVALDAALAGQLDDAGRETVYRTVWIPIDLNSATPEEILLIPGMGDRMLHEFEEYRPYRAMEEFRREIGKYVDEEEVARLEQYVMIE